MPEVHIPRDRSVPAAVQFKNPGAMWPGKIPTKWGSTKWQYLSDGTGQGGGGHGNKIAIFDDWVSGICAQLDLWRTSANYKNKKFKDAIAVWSGHNHVQSYINYLKARVPGLTEDTIMNDAFWSSPSAIPFLKAQSAHEAGRTIPAPAEAWAEAQRRVMKGFKPTLDTVKKVGKAAAGGATGGGGVHLGGLPLHWALAIGVGVAAAIFLVWYFKPMSKEEQLPAIVNPTPPDPTAQVEAIPTGDDP